MTSFGLTKILNQKITIISQRFQVLEEIRIEHKVRTKKNDIISH